MEKSGSDNSDLTFGCGNEISPRADINLNIQTTTGGTFFLPVDNYISIDELKKLVANKLKVSKDKICLLHRERILQTGTLVVNGVIDGSRIVLLPNVETGLLTQRPENSVMQALEALNEAQVTDFLSGKSPLNLTMRLGDHMMLIQLQLSTMNPVLCPPGFNSGQSRSDRRCSKSKTALGLLKKQIMPLNIAKDSPSVPLKTEYPLAEPSTSAAANDEISNENHSLNASFLQNQNLETLQNSFQLVKSFSDIHQSSSNDPDSRDLEVVSSQPFADIYGVPDCDLNNILEITELDQSPIKSLSNLVSSPLKSVPIKPVPLPSFDSLAFNSRNTYIPKDNAHFEECPEPIRVNLTSCLCKSLQSDSASSCNCQTKNAQADSTPESSAKKSVETRYKQLSALLHKTAHKTIAKNKTKQKVHSTFLRSDTKTGSLVKQSIPSTSRGGNENTSKQPSAILDSTALAEASRNLTQTLKKLSKEVLTNKKDSAEDNVRKSGQGAVIESMKHHGKGIYSGTFSGTLNPALQDKDGRPKRDITTIIHILNDLLCATPQYKQGSKVSFEPADLSTIPRISSRQSGATLSQRPVSQISDYNCSVFSNNSSTSSCTYGECNGHYPGPGVSANSSNSCCCLDNTSTSSCSGKQTANTGVSCKKCAAYQSEFCRECYSSCSLVKENYKTKCKVEQLRLIMQQKRQRREDRKLKVAPYSALAGPIRSIDSAKSVKTSVSVSSDSSPISVEEIDTLV